MKYLNKLSRQITELQTYVNQENKQDPSVSKVGTYWHLDHGLNVINGITGYLKDSNPTDYYPKRSFLKTAIMWSGYMPRGKARAPKGTVSNEEITQESLINKFNYSWKSIELLESMSEDKTFKHPMFGWMKKRKTIKFITIHTNHHLKIIKDITKQS